MTLTLEEFKKRVLLAKEIASKKASEVSLELIKVGNGTIVGYLAIRFLAADLEAGVTTIFGDAPNGFQSTIEGLVEAYRKDVIDSAEKFKQQADDIFGIKGCLANGSCTTKNWVLKPAVACAMEYTTMEKIKVTPDQIRACLDFCNKNEGYRYGQCVVNKLMPNVVCPKLFYCTNQEFWAVVFDYVTYS